MAYRHRMQTRRFELKYLVGEAKAQAIRAFVQNHLEPDEYTRPDQTLGYSVRSLYMDSPDLKLKTQTDEGNKNRFKLRIRFYDDRNESPAFLEIKRRENDVIRKQRAAVTRRGVRSLLEKNFPQPSWLLRQDAGSISAMHNFCELCRDVNAQASLFVVYYREAYVSPDSDELRVTFDRQIEGRYYQSGKVLFMSPEEVTADITGVVLEIKFTDRFPTWTRELVHSFDLQRTSVPKYVECVEASWRKHGRRMA